MKPLKAIFALAALFAAGAAPAIGADVPEEKDMGAYLMVYHKDDTHSLHMAISYDGHTFTAVNNNEPVIAGDTIAMQRGIRDPHIFRGPDGAFYLAMTDLHIYAKQAGFRQTEWERDGNKFGWGNNLGLVLMKSKDLINWTRANIRVDQLDPSLADIGCAWAPETCYDPVKKKLMVHFTMRHGKEKTKLYYFYINDDFNKPEGKPEVLFTYPKEGKEAIDGNMVYKDGTFHLFYCSHDGKTGVKQATSKSITGPWTFDDRLCDPEKIGCEAPSVYKLIGQDKWILMYDVYRANPMNFGFSETTDLETFKPLGRFDEGVMKRTNFDGQKHGAVTWLTKDEAKRLEEYWKKNQRDFPGKIKL